MASTAPAQSHEAVFLAVTAAFASLGRVCLALDAEYRIRHVSPVLDDLLGPGAADRYRNRPVTELLGSELFGPDGPIRAALAARERREGWRAWLPDGSGGRRPTSVTAAPLRHLGGPCDQDALYIVILRPADPEVGEPSGPARSTGLIAQSSGMQRVLRLIDSLDHSDVTVLIGGESGVGKGVVAQEIHARSARRERPFVAVNCAALPEALLESELFGHVRGAFTGAAAATGPAASSWPTAARSSSTRSAISRCTCKRSCSASSRRGRSSASARAARSP